MKTYGDYLKIIEPFLDSEGPVNQDYRQQQARALTKAVLTARDEDLREAQDEANSHLTKVMNERGRA